MDIGGKILHAADEIVRDLVETTEKGLWAPMRVHLGGAMLDELVDKGAEGGAGVEVDVDWAGVAPGEELGEEEAVLAADVLGVLVAELVHVAG